MTDHHPTPAELSPFFRESESFKPFAKPWCYESWNDHEQMHWLPKEVPLGDDVDDWYNNLSKGEQNVAGHILKYFTQQDVEVSGGYDLYKRFIKNFEATMMMNGFIGREMIHVDAYSHLIDTLGLPESTYSAFLSLNETRAMHDYLNNIEPNDTYGLLLSMAVFAGFAEGMALFGSFVILLNFNRFKKMRGMGQIVNWSIKDENMHVVNMCRMFREIRDELSSIVDTDKLAQDVARICKEMVGLEVDFLDLAFELGPVEGLSKEEVIRYIQFIADVRMKELGYPPVYGIEKDPLPWVNRTVYGVEHANFFETRATEYTRAATLGTWDEAFAD